MSATPLLARCVAAFEKLGVPYMLVGSFASSHHGAPRTTQDIDVVADPSLAMLDGFVAELAGPDLYLDAEVARDELLRRGQFNVIDAESGWKVDVIIAKRRPFSRAELQRRIRTAMLGVELYVASAEDTLLAKLEWAKLGESERQLRDVAGIVQLQGASLDHDYIESWLDDLGVRDLWRKVKGEANR